MKITCTIRCLEPATVEAAMARLDDEGVVRVPYTCKISGRSEEILLIGDILASRLAATLPEAEDAAGARMLAGLYNAELCECDVATLTGLPEDMVYERLRLYTARGLLAYRKIDGMHYFRLACLDARRAVASLLPN